VTNEDMMRESDYVDDYETTLAWGEDEGRRTIVATSIPSESAAVVYTRVVYVMTADTWTPLRTDFYDGDDLVRTFRYADVRPIDGKPIPMRMEIIPHESPGESTTVVYQTLEFDTRLDADLFTQRGLRRMAQAR
jgi:outer membrane lipoprotein-sorting protein